MDSSGINIAALTRATTTSDMVRIPTRPGNNSWDTLKIIQKHGRKINMDQKAARGNAAIIIEASGSNAVCKTPAKNAETAVVDKKIRAANGTIGMLDQRLRVAMPMAQKIPDNKLYISPILSGWLEASPFDSSKYSPRNATRIAINRALVNGSESQRTPIIVDQTGVR